MFIEIKHGEDVIHAHIENVTVFRKGGKDFMNICGRDYVIDSKVFDFLNARMDEYTKNYERQVTAVVGFLRAVRAGSINF